MSSKKAKPQKARFNTIHGKLSRYVAAHNMIPLLTFGNGDVPDELKNRVFNFMAHAGKKPDGTDVIAIMIAESVLGTNVPFATVCALKKEKFNKITTLFAGENKMSDPMIDCMLRSLDHMLDNDKEYPVPPTIN